MYASKTPCINHSYYFQEHFRTKVFALMFALGARNYGGQCITEEFIQYYVNATISPAYKKKNKLSEEQDKAYKGLKGGVDRVRKTTKQHMNASVTRACALDEYLKSNGMI